MSNNMLPIIFKKINLFLYLMIDNKYSEEIETKVAII
jgi:hypothetical protein